MIGKRKLLLLSIAALILPFLMTRGASWLRAGPSSSTGQAAPPANELRFPVAHMHIGTWCMGYLYVGVDGLRYEVVRPDKDKAHSFQLKRSDLRAVQPWNLFGQIQNIAEIKTSRANYHFYLLQSDADLAPERRWNVNNAAAATTLVSAILNPAGFAPPNTAANAAPPMPAAAMPASPAAAVSPTPTDAAAYASPGQPQPQYAAPQSPQAAVGNPPVASAAPDPTPVAGALDGFYGGLHISGTSVEFRYLLFTADGWVFRDYPEDGMEGFNAATFRLDPSRNKSWTGRYRLDGEQVWILWQDYADDREMIKHNEAATSAGLNVYVPLCRCDQKRFSGTYLWGLPTSGQYIQFFPDGTFLDHGTTDQLFVPSPFYDHPRVLRGAYSIQSQTLTLSFQDGRIKKKTFLAPKAQENQASFEWIGLGMHRLYEQNYQPSP